MENQAQTPIVSPTSDGTAGAGTVVTPPAEPVISTPAVAAPATPVAVDRIPTRKLIGDDDELPEGAEELVIKPSSFKGRIERAQRKHLKDNFGTDNPDEIKAKIAKLDAYEAEQEKTRLAQLSETERLKEELAREKADAEKYKAEVQSVRESYEVREQDREVIANVKQYFKSKFTNVVTTELAQHLQSVSEAAVGDDLMGYIDGWLKKYAEENPELSAQAAQAAVEVAAPQDPKIVKVVPLHNGATVSRPDAASAASVEKTAAPGRPNSMTDAEWRAHKHKLGLNF